jgi:NADH-quinone oxidoreductase subunit C
MTMTTDKLQVALRAALGDRLKSLTFKLGEVTIEVAPAHWHDVAKVLRDHSELRFEQLIDLAGLDYSAYGNGGYEGPRFAIAVHLLSVSLNQRLRVRVFAADDDLPCIASVNDVWSSANWFEREAFDMYGLLFEGHEDLRRILTDYGFIGHPLRKDFPVSGHVEMRYDAEQKRVIYQPVSIEPREVTPRVIREDHYGGLN